MKKKTLLIILMFFMLFGFGIKNVFAKTYCTYGEYKLEFEDGGSVEVYVGGALSTKYTYDVTFKPDKGKCPDKIYISKPNNVNKTQTISSSGTSGNGTSNGTRIEMLTDSYSGSTGSSKVSCGSISGIPKKIPELTNLAMLIIQIAVPVVLVIMGSIDLFKGITAGKEEELKKGQQIFIKRLIIAAIIFFVIVIVKFIVGLVADDEKEEGNILNCVDCFLNGVDNCDSQNKVE